LFDLDHDTEVRSAGTIVARETPMSRTVRRLIGLVATLGLLSAQLSLAAYACPRVAPDGAPAAMPAVHADCAEHRSAPREGALCELHCQASLSVPSSPPQDIVAPATVPLLVAERPQQSPSSSVAERRPERLAMTTAPPATIRFCRFLI
jgi:hypothetical protein